MEPRKKLAISVRLQVNIGKGGVTPVCFTLSGPMFKAKRLSVAKNYDYVSATAVTPRFNPTSRSVVRKFTGLLLERVLLDGRQHPKLLLDQDEIETKAFAAYDAAKSTSPTEWVSNIFRDVTVYQGLFQAVGSARNKRSRLNGETLAIDDCQFELVDKLDNFIITLRRTPHAKPASNTPSSDDIEIAAYLCNELLIDSNTRLSVPKSLSQLSSGRHDLKPKDIAGLPTIHDHETPGLIGRDRDIECLIKRLEARAENRIACEGLPGVGKTSVMAHIAHRLSRHHIVLWCSLGSSPDVNEILRFWSQLLSIPPEQYSGNQSTLQLQQVVKQAIADQRTAIIIDDVWSVSSVAPLLVGGQRSHTLCSSRFRHVAQSLDDGNSPYSLGVLSQSEAIALFQKIAPELSEHHETSVVELVSLLAGLPLLISCVAESLAQTSHIEGKHSLDHAIERLKNPSIRLQDFKPTDLDLARNPTLNENTALESVSLSLDCLTPDQRAAFNRLSVLRPQPARFSESLAESLIGPDAGLLLSHLKRTGLVRKAGPGTLHIHPVLTDSARLLQADSEKQDNQKQLITYFQDGLIDAIEPLSSNARDYAKQHYADRYQMRQCYQYACDLLNPEEAIDIAAAIFVVDGASGKIQDQLQWGLPLLKQIQDSLPLTLNAAYLCGGMIAWACWMGGQYEQAKASVDLAVQIADQLNTGDQHLALCIAHHNLHKSALMQMLALDSSEIMRPSHPKWKPYISCVKEAWDHAKECQVAANTYAMDTGDASRLRDTLSGMASGNQAYMLVALQEFDLAIQVFQRRYEIVTESGNAEQIAARHLDLLIAQAGLAKLAKDKDKDNAINKAESSLQEVFELIKSERIRRKDIHREYRQMREYLASLHSPSSESKKTVPKGVSSTSTTQFIFAHLLDRPIRGAAKKAAKIQINPSDYDL